MPSGPGVIERAPGYVSSIDIDTETGRQPDGIRGKVDLAPPSCSHSDVAAAIPTPATITDTRTARDHFSITGLITGNH